MYKPNPSERWYKKAIKCEIDHETKSHKPKQSTVKAVLRLTWPLTNYRNHQWASGKREIRSLDRLHMWILNLHPSMADEPKTTTCEYLEAIHMDVGMLKVKK